MLSEQLVALLNASLKHGFHGLGCNKARTNECDCWFSEVQQVLADDLKDKEHPHPSRAAVGCKTCGHKQSMHLGKLPDGVRACCKVDCSCLEMKTDPGAVSA